MNLSPRTGPWLLVLLLSLDFPSFPSTGLSQEITPGDSREKAQAVEPNPDLTLQQQQSLQEILQIRQRLGGGLTEQLQEVLGEESNGESIGNFGESLKRLIQEPRLPAANPLSSGNPGTYSVGDQSGSFPRRQIACRVAKTESPFRPGDRVDLVDVVDSTGKQRGKPVLSGVEIAAVRGAVPPVEPVPEGNSSTDFLQLEVYLDAEQKRVLDRYDTDRTWTVRRAVFSPPTALTASRLMPQAGPRPAGPDRFSPAGIERLRQVARDLERAAADLEDLEMYTDADNLRGQAQQLRTAVRRKNDTIDILPPQSLSGERR